MSNFFARFTAITLLTAGLTATAWHQGRADTGHDGHSEHGATPAAPHGDQHSEPSAPGIDGMTHDEGHDKHEHGVLEVSANQPIPSVSLAIAPDPIGGWNLEIQTENWTFAPERVNQASVVNEGHAHLYLNGEKLTRIYSQWYYLPSLPEGDHTLTVSLNANGHEALTYNEEPIEASIDLVVP